MPMKDRASVGGHGIFAPQAELIQLPPPPRKIDLHPGGAGHFLGRSPGLRPSGFQPGHHGKRAPGPRTNLRIRVERHHRRRRTRPPGVQIHPALASESGKSRGLEADQFPNTEKYLQHFTNLFNQHIGREFSPFITIGIRPVADHQVFIIACRPSPCPVFVKDKQDERFFICSGASTRQQKMSQILDYVAERRKTFT